MKQIDVKELIPFMKDGYVAMDEDKQWWFHKELPTKINNWWDSDSCLQLTMFNIAPVKNWRESLIKVENDNAR